MSTELRDALWSLHQSAHDMENDETWCVSCGVLWPCPTVVVLREGEDTTDDIAHAIREEEAWAAAAYRAAAALPNHHPDAVNPLPLIAGLSKGDES